MSDILDLSTQYNGPDPDQVKDWTDKYFMRSQQVSRAFNDVADVDVTYAIFNRVPVLYAPRFAVNWMDAYAQYSGFQAETDLLFEEGAYVGSGEPHTLLKGRMSDLLPMETLVLQKMGPAQVAAINAFDMARSLPNSHFLAMDARHDTGPEMCELMAYGASIGSNAAIADGAKGFIGNATDATAHFFGNDAGFGTMPHALIGAFGSTVEAAEKYHETFPNDPLTVLVDYHGKEVTDSIAVAKRFPELVKAGKVSVRIDTHGGRFLEGLDTAKSYAVLEKFARDVIRSYLTESEQKHLHGEGVSAAAIWHLRDQLDQAGCEQVKIVASSGFGPEKCAIIGRAGAPIDIVGTGSFLPRKWSDTYTTADIYRYGATTKIKEGREWLADKAEEAEPVQTLTLG